MKKTIRHHHLDQQRPTGENQEEAFIKAFIVPAKQDRYLQMLSNPKRRHAFLNRLNHSLELDYAAEFVVKVMPRDQTAPRIEELLRKKGAPDFCHIISSSKKWDGHDYGLREALEIVVGSGIGTVICCIPGRLAYYEGEELRDRFIFAESSDDLVVW